DADRLGRADVGGAVEALGDDVAQRLDRRGRHQGDHVEAAAGEGQVLDAGQVEQLVAGGPPLVLLDVDQDQRGEAVADPGRVDDGGEAGDDALAAQAVEAGVGGRPADAHAGGELVDRHAPVLGEAGDDPSVDVVEVGGRRRGPTAGMAGHHDLS